jgi:hypothetical protein
LDIFSDKAACCRQENAFAVAFACCPKTFGPVKLSWIPNAVTASVRKVCGFYAGQEFRAEQGS